MTTNRMNSKNQQRHPKGHPKGGQWKDENRVKPKSKPQPVGTIDLGASSTPPPLHEKTEYWVACKEADDLRRSSEFQKWQNYLTYDTGGFPTLPPDWSERTLSRYKAFREAGLLRAGNTEGKNICELFTAAHPSSKICPPAHTEGEESTYESAAAAHRNAVMYAIMPPAATDSVEEWKSYFDQTANIMVDHWTYQVHNCYTDRDDDPNFIPFKNLPCGSCHIDSDNFLTSVDVACGVTELSPSIEAWARQLAYAYLINK